MEYSPSQHPGTATAASPDTWTASEGPARRTAFLARNSTRVVGRAREAGVPITYLGIAPIFAEPRAYAGPQTDWVLSPVHDLSDAVIPRAERAALLRLADARIDFPMTYIAHEIPKGRLALPDRDQPEPEGVAVDQGAAHSAIGPLPPPAAAVALADRLGRSSHHLLNVLAMAVPIAGAVVAAPFVLAGAAAAAVGELILDPIVFGVIPAGPPVPGQPTAWYTLARWEWQSTPHLDLDE
jgi:hypothetical protein